MPSPPKPWERAGAATATTSDTPPITSSLADTSSSTSFQSSSGDAPSIPNRPSTMNSLSRPGGYGSTAYGGLNSGLNSGLGSGYNSGYGSTYGSSLSSPYNRFGSGGYGSSYGSSYGGGYGGYGSSYGSGAYGSRYGAGGYGVGGYGGYGSYGGHGGMNRMGMGGYGAQGGPGMPGPNGELPLTARIEQSTASAFQMIDQIVQAFGGFSQMLESTFFATHSSFMAMVGVAEQFGHLRTYLGRALSIMAFVNMVKRGVYRMLGKTPPAVPGEALSVESFEEFKKDDGGKSKRPMWLFIALLIGLPWLMSKLIKRLQQMSLEEAGKVLTPAEGPEAPIHASQIKDLEFCRALYDFKGEGPAELTFSKGDIIAVLSKEDPSTKQPSMWWRGRLRSGPIGYFPANYVEVIEKKVGTSPVQQPQQTMQQQNFKQNQQETFGQQQSFGQMSQQPYQPTLQQQKMGAAGDGGGFNADDFSMQNAFGGR